MNFLRAFAPWLVYAVVPAAHWQWAALAAALIALAELTARRRAGSPLDALIIEIGSLIYFSGLSVVAFVAPDTPLHAYAPSLANGALALIASASLALGVPFTMGIAKQSTPREFWETPLFVRTGYVLTWVWTGAFLLGCVTLALVAHAGTLPLTVVHVFTFGVPAVFTLWYAERVKARALAVG